MIATSILAPSASDASRQTTPPAALMGLRFTSATYGACHGPACSKLRGIPSGRQRATATLLRGRQHDRAACGLDETLHEIDVAGTAERAEQLRSRLVPVAFERLEEGLEVSGLLPRRLLQPRQHHVEVADASEHV